MRVRVDHAIAFAAACAVGSAFLCGAAAGAASRETIVVSESHDNVRVVDAKGRTLASVDARPEEGFAPQNALQPERGEQLSPDGRWLRVRAYAASNVGPPRRYTFLVFVPTGERIDEGRFPAAFGVAAPDLDFTFVSDKPATLHIDYLDGSDATLKLPRAPKA